MEQQGVEEIGGGAANGVNWKKCRDCIKRKIGVGCDGFHTKVLLDSTKETRGEIVEFLEKVEQSGNDTLVGSSESTIGGEVAAEVPF